MASGSEDLALSALAAVHGSSERIQFLVRQLRATLPMKRARALELLYEEVSGVERRAVDAAHSLLALVQDDTAPNRHRAAALLGAWVRDPECGAAVAEVLVSRVSGLIQLLWQSDAALRSSAAFLLGGLTTTPQGYGQTVEASVENDPDACAVASKLLCLSAWGHEYEPAHRLDQDPRVAAARTIVALTLQPRRLHEQALRDALVEAAALHRERQDVLRANDSSLIFPWAGGVWAKLVTGVLAFNPADDVRGAIDILTRTLAIRLARGERLPVFTRPDPATLQSIRALIGVKPSKPREAQVLEQLQRYLPIVEPSNLHESGSLLALVDLAALLTHRESDELTPGSRRLRDLLARDFPSDSAGDDEKEHG